MEPVPLRAYQRDAVSAVESAWMRGVNHVGIVMATGLGKTFPAAELAIRARSAGRRSVILVPNERLLHQAAKAVAARDPGGQHVGIVAGELDDHKTDIVAATFQTLQNANRIEAVGKRDLVISDECFPAGTLVDGRPIESFRVGDPVTAFDESSGALTPSRVTQVFRSAPSALVRVTLASGFSVVCTPGHPLLTGTGWEAAVKTEGRCVRVAPLLGGGGEWEPVVSVTVEDALRPVYNLEVETHHTYLVGGHLVVHNCHHAPARTFSEVLDWFGAGEGGPTRSVGLTATMFRADGKPLTGLWEEIVFERDLLWAVESGYLVAPRGKTVRLDELSPLAALKGNDKGDYKQNEVADVVARASEPTADAIMRHAAERQMIVFAANREHAEAIQAALAARGMAAETITGRNPPAERSRLCDGFSARRIQALVTVRLLTEGVDLPICDAVVMACPTRSPNLYTQMVGRALRLHTDERTGKPKADALVLDLVGTVHDNALMTVGDLLPETKVERFTAAGDVDTSAPRPPRSEPERKREYVDGVPEMVEVDLFSRASQLVWLATEDGVIFTPMREVRNGYIFLWPPNPKADGQVALGRMISGNVDFMRDGSGAIQAGTPGQARVKAESDSVMPKEHRSLSRASWRRGRVPPSPQQQDLARKLGLAVDEYPTKALLSDALSTVFAGRAFARRTRTIDGQYRSGLPATKTDERKDQR